MTVKTYTLSHFLIKPVSTDCYLSKDTVLLIIWEKSSWNNAPVAAPMQNKQHSYSVEWV